jgi:predicted peroxiredoxin
LIGLSSPEPEVNQNRNFEIMQVHMHDLRNFDHPGVYPPDNLKINNLMRTTNFIFMILIMIISACKNTGQQAPAESLAEGTIRDGVFIHITQCYNDPHRVLMPLKMATIMANDRDVIVYMDIHAVNLLVRSAKDIEFADFESAHSYVRQLIERKVGVYACPTCLKIAGFKPEDLLEGVQLAQKDRFFDFTRGRIVALNY